MYCVKFTNPEVKKLYLNNLSFMMICMKSINFVQSTMTAK